MTERRFSTGQGGVIGGVPWRIREGYKGPDDLVLDLFCPDGVWRPARMHLCALMVDFLQENEERLFPQTVGGQGRRMFFDFLRAAITDGWEVACSNLDAQKRKAATRRMRDAA